jgi:hypothetical protein
MDAMDVMSDCRCSGVLVFWYKDCTVVLRYWVHQEVHISKALRPPVNVICKSVDAGSAACLRQSKISE